MPLASAPARSPSPRRAPPPAASGPARPFARIEICEALEDARQAWTTLAQEAPASPYQSFDFARVWFATIGAAEGATPLIVVARDESGQPVALLPFARAARGPLRFAVFLGGKDSNFNLGLFRSGGAWSRERRRRAPRRGGDARVAAARRLPALQPAAELARHRQSARRRQAPAEPQLRLCERPARRLFRLARRARFERGEEEDAQEARAARSDGAARPQPRRRARKRSIARLPPSMPSGARAPRRSARPIPTPPPPRKNSSLGSRAKARSSCMYLAHGERIIAVFGALPGAERLSGLFIGHDGDPEIARSSPGEIMVQAVVADAIARGFAEFDLGVGEARYKDEACEIVEPLFDSAFAVTLKGRLAAWAFLAARRAKRAAKRSPRLKALHARLRRLSGRSGD